MADECCLNCKYFAQTGFEDSGIKDAYDPTKNWHYPIGNCAHPKSGASGIASFLSCYRWKKRRKKGESA